VRASTALLIAGNVMAVPLTLYTPGFLRMWRRREPALFAVEEAGMVLITAGWAAKGNVPAAAFNGLWLVGFAGAYALEGRKRARVSAGG
jgi:hypothetical protein